MFFSVIVPVYKVEKYLANCIESVLNQTFSDFELILVDDGSTDGCPQICDDYKERDQRVKVIHKPNGGLASARRAGIKASEG
ncbi:MAG: glycosyltransferase family 2 protein, partial [Clostridia bacterium]|nr:glycosyltransferase family 2 protein [Clostridia bacterium]